MVETKKNISQFYGDSLFAPRGHLGSKFFIIDLDFLQKTRSEWSAF